MIEQKIIMKDGKVCTMIKTSKNIKSNFEQFSLAILLKKYKCMNKWHSRQYRYYLVDGNTLE